MLLCDFNSLQAAITCIFLLLFDSLSFIYYLNSIFFGFLSHVRVFLPWNLYFYCLIYHRRYIDHSPHFNLNLILLLASWVILLMPIHMINTHRRFYLYYLWGNIYTIFACLISSCILCFSVFFCSLFFNFLLRIRYSLSWLLLCSCSFDWFFFTLS